MINPYENPSVTSNEDPDSNVSPDPTHYAFNSYFGLQLHVHSCFHVHAWALGKFQIGNGTPTD